MVANGVVVDIKTGEPVNKQVEENPTEKETTKTSTKREKK